jgi:hypothetical protein
MDNFHPQSETSPVLHGHDESDINVRGIILSGALLVIGGIFTFIITAFLYRGLEKWEASRDARLSTVEQQLRVERKSPTPSTSARDEEETRAQTEQHLERTFPAPRLQYDDVYDLNLFRSSEDAWLSSTGRTAQGSIHIPIERAIDLIAQQGLPSVSGSFLPANVPANTPLPGGPQSGNRENRPSGGNRK